MRAPTLGLGVSSHELWDGRRRANVSNLDQYLAALDGGRRPVALDEEVGAGGGRAGGDLPRPATVQRGPAERIAAFVVGSQDVRLWNDYEGWLSEGILERAGDRVRFTERGYLVSNEVS